MTRQRALILGIMREKCPEHLTADEIFSHARQAMPHIARGTVYRHLLCDSCGDLADLPVVGLIRDIESAIGTEVRGYTLTIRYICPKCRAKNAQ